jgi:hypothetical protein
LPGELLLKTSIKKNKSVQKELWLQFRKLALKPIFYPLTKFNNCSHNQIDSISLNNLKTKKNSLYSIKTFITINSFFFLKKQIKISKIQFIAQILFFKLK